MAAWQQDITYSLRRLRQSRAFAAAALISIGLGIAANATIFSMVSALLLRTAPVGHPSTLVSVYAGQHGECCSTFSWLLYSDVRDHVQSFSGVTAYFPLVPASIGGRGAPERVWGQAATRNFFDVVQLRMILGRGFAPDEEHLRVIVLSDRIWQRRFGADPSIAGKAILLSGRPFTVVGVAPPYFRGLDLPLDPEFWIPLGNLEELMPKTGDPASRASGWLEVAARLRPGVTRGQAEAELGALGQRLSQAYPDTEKNRAFRVERAGELPVRYKGAVRMFLAALMVVVMLVLGIACANVANLLLAQATARQPEMAVRLALGATRGRLLRQMLTECLLLALGGGLLGVALSWWATRGLSAFRLPLPIPLDLHVTLDSRVLLYSLTVSIGSALVFGLAPGWAVSRRSILSNLRTDRRRLRSGLVIAQIAMSVVLLCATGLFLRSLQHARSIDTGFRSQGVVTMAVDPALHAYSAQRTIQFLTQVRERVTGLLPGGASAAWTDTLPLSVGGRRDGFQAEGQTGEPVLADLYMVTSGYFDTLRMPLLAGRDFRNENAREPKVAVVNQAFAQRLFGPTGAIGRHVTGPNGTYQIIGLVKNIKSRTLGEELRPVLYRSLAQDIGSDPSFLGYTLLVRSQADSVTVSKAVRREIQALDPTLAVFNTETLEKHLEHALFLPRLAATLFGVCGGVGLLLAAVGLYGVMSYSVARRGREIGIRIALGAQSREVQRLIVRQGLWLTSIAVALGLGAALTVAKVSAAWLYGVRPYDVVTFTLVPVFLTMVAWLACWIPSRRAARVEPLTALRYE